jgi:CBS domain-containing protein
MQVKDVMTAGPVVVSADAPIREAAALLRKHRIGGLPVMEGERLAGIITEGDILRLLEKPSAPGELWLPSPLEALVEIPIRLAASWAHTRRALTHIGDQPVGSVMSSPAITVGEDEDMESAAAILVERRIGRLPVVREGKLVGIIARADIVRALGESYGSKGDEEGGP